MTAPTAKRAAKDAVYAAPGGANLASSGSGTEDDPIVPVVSISDVPGGPTGWIATATATHAAATASKAGVAGKTHYLRGFSASFSTTLTPTGALLQIKDGSSVIYEEFVYTSVDRDFRQGIPITEGATLSAGLADGGSGVIGKVNLYGSTL